MSNHLNGNWNHIYSLFIFAKNTSWASLMCCSRQQGWGRKTITLSQLAFVHVTDKKPQRSKTFDNSPRSIALWRKWRGERDGDSGIAESILRLWVSSTTWRLSGTMLWKLLYSSWIFFLLAHFYFQSFCFLQHIFEF